MGQYLDNPSETPHWIDVITTVNAISKIKPQIKEEGWKSSKVLYLQSKGSLLHLKKRKAVREIYILFAAFWNSICKCTEVVTGWEIWQLRRNETSLSSSVRVEVIVHIVGEDAEVTDENFASVFLVYQESPVYHFLLSKPQRDFTDYWLWKCSLNVRSDQTLLTKQSDT